MEKELSCLNCTRGIGCGGIFSKKDTELVNVNKSNLNYTAGETIIKQGGLISNIISLRKGLIKVVSEGKNNRNTLLKIIDEKSLIAFSGLSELTNYPFSLVALTPVNICQIRKETLNDISTRDVRINKLIINKLVNDNLFYGQRISILNTRNNCGKLASALLFLFEIFSDKQIFEYVSRKDLAELACISIESLNKILMQLKNDKIIYMDSKSLNILQPELINRLSLIG